MRKVLFVLSILFSGYSFGQNYTLFNSSSKKLFTEFPTPSRGFSLAFDSVKLSGGDSIYYNFFQKNDTLIVPDTCSFWGPQDCQHQNLPVWLGKKIVFDNGLYYKFFTNANDTLKFNFNLPLGDSALFHSDNVQKFYFVFTKRDTLTVLNSFDSARFYRIHHTDLLNISINSLLNGKEIIVVRNQGLSQFFQVDSFPQVLRSLSMIGNTNPSAGLTKITNEILYDYQPGDEIEYHEYANYQNAPPWMSYNRYRKYTILNRTTTVDSIFYLTQQYLYIVSTSQYTIDTLTLRYKKSRLVISNTNPFLASEIPFEKYDRNHRSIYLKDYCNIKRWTYKIIPDPYLGYCPLDNCWGQVDTNGPCETGSTTYVIGIGIYDFNGTLVDMTNGHYRSNQIVYFKKNGQPCGMLVDATNFEAPEIKISLYPNPASTSISMLSSIEINTISIFDISGKLISTNKIVGLEASIDIASLNEGIYFARFFTHDERSTTKKIVVLKN